ncbi:MAG: hypothetical protein M3Y83_15970 [Actinomycetota bacterium]|nr:hypothetical protein [Actinomycetota bacterium]
MPDPITAWVDVLTTAFNNGGQIAEEILSNPFPALQQFLANQLGYATTIGNALEQSGQNFVGFLTGDDAFSLVPLVQTMFSDLTSGDMVGAVSAFNNILLGLLIAPLAPLAFQALPILGQITENLHNVVLAVQTPVLFAALGALSPVLGATTAFGDTSQVFVDAMSAGDPLTALNALANIPAAMAGAFLNGYPGGYVGILTPAGGIGSPGGIINTLLVDIPRAIAQGLGASAASALVADEQAPAADSADSQAHQTSGEGVALSADPAVVTKTDDGAAAAEAAAVDTESADGSDPDPAGSEDGTDTGTDNVLVSKVRNSLHAVPGQLGLNGDTASRDDAAAAEESQHDFSTKVHQGLADLGIKIPGKASDNAQVSGADSGDSDAGGATAGDADGAAGK